MCAVPSPTQHDLKRRPVWTHEQHVSHHWRCIFGVSGKILGAGKGTGKCVSWKLLVAFSSALWTGQGCMPQPVWSPSWGKPQLWSLLPSEARVTQWVRRRFVKLWGASSQNETLSHEKGLEVLSPDLCRSLERIAAGFCFVSLQRCH